MRAPLMLLLLSLSATASEAELFVDRGETYVRAGSDQGLARGTSLPVLGKAATGPEKKRAGTATVMEVWPQLARVNLDEAAKADKATTKWVALPGGEPAPAPAAAPAPVAAPAPAAPPAGPVAPAAPTEKPASGGLVGRATYGGAGPWTAVRLYNDSARDWAGCALTVQPNKLTYTLKRLKAHDHELIALSNFQGGSRGPEPTSVHVRCAEGEATFQFE